MKCEASATFNWDQRLLPKKAGKGKGDLGSAISGKAISGIAKAGKVKSKIFLTAKAIFWKGEPESLSKIEKAN